MVLFCSMKNNVLVLGYYTRGPKWQERSHFRRNRAERRWNQGGLDARDTTSRKAPVRARNPRQCKSLQESGRRLSISRDARGQNCENADADAAVFDKFKRDEKGEIRNSRACKRKRCGSRSASCFLIKIEFLFLANTYILAKDNDINSYDYEKYLEELEFPPTIKIQKIINRVLNTKTTLHRLRKAPPNIINSKELQNLANSFLWWIYEREFGQCRRNILNEIYNKMAYSFVSLLNIQAGNARDDILDHLPTIVAQIVWLALWHQERGCISKPIKLLASHFACNFRGAFSALIFYYNLTPRRAVISCYLRNRENLWNSTKVESL